MSDKENYPTKWEMIDGFARQECRQIADDTFELRDPDGIITIHQTGLNLYKTGQTSAFIQWLKANNVEIRDRNDD